jgi:hypothetical protein
MVLNRKPAICLLVTSLLILSLAVQGGATLKMACEGTAACCCQTNTAMPADTGPMGGGCCAIPEAQPCDLAVPVSSPADPFLPTDNSPGPEASAALAYHTPISDAAAQGGPPASVICGPPSVAGPPVYLLIQTFLC